MKATVRSVEGPELEDKIAQLRILSYPDFPEVHEVDYYSSLYRWYQDHPLAGKMYRWVAATEEGEIVGHLTAFPQFYRIDGQRVIAHTPGDYMVLPQHGFQAIMLMRAFFRTIENCVVCDMVPAVIGIETRLGAEVVGDLPYAAKLMNRGLEAVDEALGSSFGGDLEAETLDSFDDSFDDLFERVAAVVPCLAEKDAAFLRWRYGPGSPQAPVTVLGVKSSGRLLGYAVLKAAFHGQDGYILDLTAFPGRQDVVRSLLLGTVRSFRRMGVQIIRYRFTESPTAPRSADLRRLGFFYRRGRRNKLLVKFTDSSLRETTGNLANWSLSFGDGEAGFWLR